MSVSAIDMSFCFLQVLIYLICTMATGFGVVRRCMATFGSIPRTIYISHNHSDHAGELPVLLAVESAASGDGGGDHPGPMHVLSEEGVMQTLIEHRLHELVSTGRCENLTWWV